MVAHLTPKDRIAKKTAVYEFLNAAAEHGNPVPSCERLGQMVGTRHSTVLMFILELEAEGAITQVVTTKGRKSGRVVTITATGKTSAPHDRTAASTYSKGAAKRDAELDRGARAEAIAVDARIYGGILPDVQFLRRRGWVIHHERGAFRVGNDLISAADIVAKAARERRLAGVAQ